MNVLDFPQPANADLDAIRAALSVLVDGVFEVRIPKAGKLRTVRGYFNDIEKAAKAAAAWSGKAPAIYVTLNPVNPALLARAANRMETYAEATTSDADILSRRWLLIDIDPRRPAGISASESEHRAALAKMREIADWLTLRGWPSPLRGDSGNGGHLLYRIALSNEPDNTKLLERSLKALAARFNTAAVEVDTSVYNASRISKLYGTLAGKGDDTPDRPHRISSVLSVPAEFEPVALELLEELAADWTDSKASRQETPLPSGGDFFSSVNQLALSRLDAWVPALFPSAKPYRNGYRVTSKNLSRDCDEDLGIQPDGIKDFGVHDTGDSRSGKRTPIDLVMEWDRAGDAKTAAFWLCSCLGAEPERLGWKKPAATHEPVFDLPPLDAYAPDFGEPILTQPIPPGQEFIALADFISKPPTSTYLIKKVLPARGIGQVFGSSNVGKSFLLIDLAMHLASGKAWRGHKTKKVGVLYIAAEGIGGLAGRMRAWTQRYRATPDALFVRPYSAQLTARAWAAELAKRIRELPVSIQLIILDTLAANFGPGSENDAEDMAAAMDGLRLLAGDWFALCAHHSGHADKTRSRGHSSLFAALDIEFQIVRDDPTGPMKVAHTKCRDMERMDPLFFNLEPEPLPWCDEDGEPIDSAVIVPADAPGKSDEDRDALTGNEARAFQVLIDLYDRQRLNLGKAGVPRVTLTDWNREIADFVRYPSHRSRIKITLLQKGKIREEHPFVYIV